MHAHTAFFPILLLLSASAVPGPRTSADYSIPADTTDGGGRKTASANYSNDGSAGGVAGISTVAAPAETVKGGYVGQLYDVTGLVLNSSALTVNETATLQLAAWQLLDDASFLAVRGNSVAWLVVSGPMSGISAAGLATAGTVPQNIGATVQGSFGGFTGTLSFTVLDTIADNFGSYAADGLPDDWQVQYFGLNNPNAGPNADPTGGGQNNFFKYIAGLNPLDPNARFLLNSVQRPAQPGQMRLTFSPIVSGRTYTVKFRTDLATGAWLPLTGATFIDSGNERTVTDTGATGSAKFYRIEITKP